MVLASFPTELSYLSSFGRELSPFDKASEQGPCMCRGFVPAVYGCYRFFLLHNRHVCPGSAEKSCHVALGRHLESNKIEAIRPWSVHVRRGSLPVVCHSRYSHYYTIVMWRGSLPVVRHGPRSL